MAEYLKYILKTVEPIRIADDSKAQSGQTDTLRYIPGSTVRGLVVNACSTDDGFDEMKKAL